MNATIRGLPSNCGAAILSGVLVLGLLVSAGPEVCRADSVFQGVLDRFSPCDINADGIREISRLGLTSFESASATIPADARLVLVMVRPRLLVATGVVPRGSGLTYQMHRLRGDLEAEGYVVRVLEAEVYAGSQHQDGRTVLALRAFFQGVQAAYRNFQGVILVGSFPEPMLVRRWLWKQTAGPEGIDIGAVHFPGGTEFLRMVPEIVAERADLVLADLDGNWHEIYEKGPLSLESIVAKPDASPLVSWYFDGATLTCPQYTRTSLSFQDFFWIRDDNYVAWQEGPTLKLRIFTGQLHPEMNLSDRKSINPVARPEIFISRINPLHIAVHPDPAFTDVSGRHFLDAGGKPQMVQSTAPLDLSIGAFWHRDSALERRILGDYLDRNHAYRIGGDSHLPFRTAAIGKDLSAAGLSAMLQKASSAFGTPLVVENASLLDYVNWLTQAACYRGITAHSNPWNSAFGNNYATADLEVAVGGHPWRWKKQGATNAYQPSLVDQGGTADLYLHRTLWENGILAGAGGRLYLHNGCQVNSPGGADTLSYSHGDYGTFQNAEGVLFYLNGVALCARAKVFYDAPRGFSEALGATARSHFGSGWRAYFDEEAKDPALATMVADNKRCYTWSILGDWTVRLRYRNGLGLLGLDGARLADQAIHPNEAWIGGWDFSSVLNAVRGIGDFDGDGRDDIILTSTWGLGIVGHDGTVWKALVAKPAGTSFGGWSYKSTDHIRGVGDFNGDGKADLLVSSSWGLGILTLSGSTLTSLVAKAKGTSFDGWLFNPDDNVFAGLGDLDGNGADDILISSPWGIGILKVQGSTLGALVVRPRGTAFGRWTYDGDTVIQGLGDFDGNGSDDILVSGPAGLGILKLQGSTLTALVAQPRGTVFGGWRHDADDAFQGIDDFDGDGVADILISDAAALGILKVQGSTLATVVSKTTGAWMGGWLFNARDNVIEGTGDFDGNGTADILISSPWGMGILTLAGSALNCVDLVPNARPVGRWYLQETDLVCGVGKLAGGSRAQLLLQKYPAP
ncbi:MAG: VCBS repeat-containing protein [Planctomycetes bacterium]|jgi:hypothetical protein|nr:VCBS repeat-containing protein [Planctomycetota bacterium]